MTPPLYELTLYVDVPPDKADYLLEKLCNTVEDYGYGWERASGKREPEECERCNECGRTYEIVWAAPHDLWNSVNGGPDGMLCPDCFDKKCIERDNFLYWIPGPHRGFDEWMSARSSALPHKTPDCQHNPLE